ncbi:MAG: NUDIX domain-containing protein [Armatimonadota bacterium]
MTAADQPRRHTHLGAYGLVLWQDKVLLVLKSRGPYIGSWDLPGGRIEFGESPEITLKREMAEETGLQLMDTPQLIASCSHTRFWTPDGEPDKELHHLGFIYRVSLSADGETQKRIVSQAQEDVQCAEWKLLRDTVTLPLTPFAEEMLQRLLNSDPQRKS